MSSKNVEFAVQNIIESEQDYISRNVGFAVQNILESEQDYI